MIFINEILDDGKVNTVTLEGYTSLEEATAELKLMQERYAEMGETNRFYITEPTVDDLLLHFGEYNEVLICRGGKVLEEYDGRNSLSDKYLDHEVTWWEVTGKTLTIFL